MIKGLTGFFYGPPVQPRRIPPCPPMFPPGLFDSKGRRGIIVCGPNISHDTWRRAVFEDEGCTIYAWPCRGGVVIKENADVVDMAFLGFDKFDPPTHRFPAAEQEKEDDFARTLLKIGAKLWSSQRRYADVSAGAKEAEEDELGWKFYGWPAADGSAGVWYLEVEFGDEKLNDTARLRMAVTMGERCAVLQRLGATFFEDPKECPGLTLAYGTFHGTELVTSNDSEKS